MSEAIVDAQNLDNPEVVDPRLKALYLEVYNFINEYAQENKDRILNTDPTSSEGLDKYAEILNEWKDVFDKGLERFFSTSYDPPIGEYQERNRYLHCLLVTTVNEFNKVNSDFRSGVAKLSDNDFTDEEKQNFIKTEAQKIQDYVRMQNIFKRSQESTFDFIADIAFKNTEAEAQQKFQQECEKTRYTNINTIDAIRDNTRNMGVGSAAAGGVVRTGPDLMPGLKK